MSNKVLYRDIVPYDLPSAWSALEGPAFGVIDLPITVFWGPDRSFDLSDSDEVRFAYQQLVREGRVKSRADCSIRDCCGANGLGLCCRTDAGLLGKRPSQNSWPRHGRPRDRGCLSRASCCSSADLRP